MKTKYDYIYFDEVESGTGGKSSWICRSNVANSDLGVVKYQELFKLKNKKGMWHYHPSAKSVYTPGALSDIVDFIKQLK